MPLSIIVYIITIMIMFGMSNESINYVPICKKNSMGENNDN